MITEFWLAPTAHPMFLSHRIGEPKNSLNAGLTFTQTSIF